MAELNLADLPGVTVAMHRFDRAVVIDVSWLDGRETFFLVEGDRSLGLMAFDPTDTSYGEPRAYVVPKPFRMNLQGSQEDLLLLIWQVLGGER